ncbi:MAG: NADPH-dependent 7-cyano-7-deazaguanine reductase QueF [Candidatus Lambdaproteobacteria bacterium]|nr:NADPH-dependent 7-cyano-7-deazaguanine reductase QueF [Candidatus Lambdaproteobacteria bacterium]
MDVTDPSYAEGRILQFESEEHIRSDLLQTFPYQGPRQRIVYETREFSAVCPYSGLPDYGTLSIEYIPARTIVELKSLKYYIVSFRNVGIFQEPATARLYNDLHALLQPEFLCVKTVYNVRGGIDATSEIRSDRQ